MNNSYNNILDYLENDLLLDKINTKIILSNINFNKSFFHKYNYKKIIINNFLKNIKIMKKRSKSIKIFYKKYIKNKSTDEIYKLFKNINITNISKYIVIYLYDNINYYIKSNKNNKEIIIKKYILNYKILLNNYI